MENQLLPEEPVKSEPVWAVVANIVLERPYGPGGEETRSGTRKFRGGAKVVCLFFHAIGVDESVLVVGRHRSSNQYISSYVRFKQLANWRVELIYNPAIIKRIQRQWEWNDSRDWDCKCGQPGCKEGRMQQAWQEHLERLELRCSGGEKAKATVERTVEYIKSGGWEGFPVVEQPFVSTRTTRKQDLNQDAV